jgi:hypothetical protein
LHIRDRALRPGQGSDRRSDATVVAPSAKADQDHNPGRQRRGCAVPHPTTSRPPPRFLEQRFELGADLLSEIAIPLDLRPARRRCDGHCESL